MKCPMTPLQLCCLLLGFTVQGGAVQDLATPIQKVVHLLQGLKTKGEKDMQEEQLQFAKFHQFCEDDLAKKKSEIQANADKIESLSAEIEKAEANAERLEHELKAHQAGLDSVKAEKENATEVRKAAAADFLELHTDVSESVSALDRAIKVLRKQAFDRPKAEAAPENATAFLQMPLKPSFLDITDADWHRAGKAVAFALDSNASGAPDADAYEFQSDGVIDMLKGLQKQFVKQQNEIEASEQQAKNAHELLLASLQTEMSQHERAIAKKTSYKQRALEDAARASDDRSSAQEEQAADRKYANDLSTECKVKAVDFAERQKVRTAEIKAVEQATEILKGSSFVQRATSSSTALALLRGQSSESGVDKVVRFLQERAKVLQSRSFDRLLQQVESKASAPDSALSSRKGAVKSISDLLKDLLNKLQDAHTKETEKKAWCDEEIGTNALTREDKTEETEQLHAALELLQVSIAKLTEENAALASDVAKLDSDLEQSLTLREEERDANFKAIDETTSAQAAVESAITVLKSFYDGEGLARSFLQVQKEAAHANSTKPEFAAGNYAGIGESNVITLMEGIVADLMQEAADIRAAERTADQAHRQFVSDAKADKASKETAARKNRMKSMQQSSAVAERTKELDAAEKQLAAATEYYDQLKKQCLGKDLSYEEEQQRRAETVESLQKALEMLSDASPV